jgi:nucleotide-binding universal stress UspA family protein
MARKRTAMDRAAPQAAPFLGIGPRLRPGGPGEIPQARGMVGSAAGMISTIAVGTDGSDTASKAVDVAVEMARRFDAKVFLLSSYRDPAAGSSSGRLDEREWAWNPAAQLREILARTERDIQSEGIDCVTRTGKGNPAKTLVELAEDCDADLLVIGNKGMQRRVLGSVPNSVAHNAPCSVLVVKTT